ncbi:tRNA modification GTPase MnmE [Aeromonas caviae]|nr:tRNA modification GTPase MnmE [Aeromonas caviae]GKR26726.1 tRNA modification GTPase MnmE [Aeromonas caviae]GKR30999.1 tRNA modification GTPase MnmE [Aeromonas caviae]GKR64924.1 tRNA modification GTPase MnmE [Aeromonas caviae]GKR81769.1 tRNA modification GTPase MnmE [Aeromonas caviae]
MFGDSQFTSTLSVNFHFPKIPRRTFFITMSPTLLLIQPTSESSKMTTDTIVAQATAPGRGGVGIVRVSGPAAERVAEIVLGKLPRVRYAEYLPFRDEQGQALDQGIALLFKAPNSFTGEDVLELQGHGGPVILDMLIRRILQIDGIRPARPGEFSERAFLNDKLDLAQAEAIADLIEASSEQAARSAMHSLQGQFSGKVQQLVESLTRLRIYVEAAIDFPDEEIDFLSDGKVAGDLYAIMSELDDVRSEAKQGALLREGMKVVIAGRPNAGKSSLLNALAGRESAIVTEIAGTTRDVLREHIHLDGMPLHIIDTAGLRDTQDKVEQIGIERAWAEIEQADRVLFMVDGTTTDAVDPHDIWPEFVDRLPKNIGLTVVRNKADLTGEDLAPSQEQGHAVYRISAKTELGLPALREHLKACMGFQGNTEGGFMARRRHLDALERAAERLLVAREQLEVYVAGELVAEELRLAQESLSEITGEFSSDDLLGRIFSSFCIGK